MVAKPTRGDLPVCRHRPDRLYVGACAEVLHSTAHRSRSHPTLQPFPNSVSVRTAPPLDLIWHMQQHVGRVRDNQEDSAAIHKGAFLRDGKRAALSLFQIADGCGGMAGGEVASAICCREIPTTVLRHAPDMDVSHAGVGAPDLDQAIHAGFNAANESILRAVQKDPALAGMASTAVLLAIDDDGRGTIAWAGDSRAYRLRGGHLEQLTQDHNRASLLIREGIITAEDAETHPAKHQLTNALGMREDAIPDVVHCTVRPGDCFILTTDGFHDGVSEDDIVAYCRAHLHDPVDAGQLQSLAQALEDHILVQYGQDNLTAVLVYAAPSSKPAKHPAFTRNDTETANGSQDRRTP